MDAISTLFVVVIILVVAFDFTNGFHDASDMIATAIASRAMTPGMAILIVTIFTFIAPFSIGLAVADTVGNFVDVSSVSPIVGETLIIAALLAAITYNLITWLFGYPSSSSNSLAGGLIGAGLCAVGESNIHWGWYALQHGELTGLMKVLAGLFLAPFLGFLIGFLVMKLFLFIFRRFNTRINRFFVFSQYLSVAWLGFSHGANDAQKGMAIIGMVLLANGVSTTFSIPDWVIVLCASSITLGTLFGGWRIIKTLGYGLFRVKIIHSVSNQLSAALVNSIATGLGAPTSTSQVVTASLIGCGATEKPQHIRWSTVSGIVSGWYLNIPVSILLGWLYCYIFLKLWG